MSTATLPGVRPSTHPRRRSEQPERSLVRKRFKIASMLHSAYMHHMRTLLDPRDDLDGINEQLDDLPEFDTQIEQNLSRRCYDGLNDTIASINVRLRYLRDIIERAMEYETRVERVLEGKLPTADLPIPNLHSFMSEVEAMTRYFTRVLTGFQVIAVVTDDIVLSDDHGNEFNFGPFKITLDLHEYKSGPDARNPYTVHACNPHRPRNGDRMEHPHTQSYVLCEGAAKEPINRALDEGRFFDFFHIVNNTLQVYNAESPYMKLHYWTGNGGEYTCEDCGTAIDDDAESTCGNCGMTVCDDCSRYCEAGDLVICQGCEEHSESHCAGCNQFGSEDCRIHSNEACEICGSTPTDNEEVECDRGYTFHTACIEGADERPDACEQCRDLKVCTYLPDALKNDEDEDEPEEQTQEEEVETDDADSSR